MFEFRILALMSERMVVAYGLPKAIAGTQAQFGIAANFKRIASKCAEEKIDCVNNY